MGESLVSKGADVFSSLNKGQHVRLVSLKGASLWHLLSKGHRVNIPEPDTWMLRGFSAVSLSFGAVGSGSHVGHGNV